MNHLKSISISLIMAIIALTNLCQAQDVELMISVYTDNKPEEISWTLYDEMENVVATDSGKIVNSSTWYELDLLVDQADCFRFEIRDEGGDGITPPGIYKIKYDGIVVAYMQQFESFAEHYINCSDIGASCEKALPLYADVISSPVRENNWYKINFKDTVFVTVDACNNYIPDNTTYIFLDTEIWIYDSCPTTLSDGPEGAISYNEYNFYCEPSSTITNFRANANQDYYVRVKCNDLDWQENIVVSFIKIPDLLGCTNKDACNYNPFANRENDSCIFEDCLPDISINQEALANTLKLDSIDNTDECFIEEGCLRGMGVRDIIRFDTEISNIGNTDFIIGYPDENSEAFSKDNCHEHWHQLGYAEYLLYAGSGDPEPIGFKNGFCVIDLECDPGVEIKYNCNYMGISVGCTDLYWGEIECQWIDVTDTPDGDYTLVTRVNWTQLPDLRGKPEADYENNWAQACFNLDRSSGELVLTKYPDCTPYTDCFGVLFGDAVLDCQGVCDGLAHFGDINNDQLLNDEDITAYLQAIAWDQANNSDCYDLDGNEVLNTYDVALLRECTENSEGESVADHSHCLFPAGYVNINQTVSVQMQEHDADNRSIDLEYLSPQNDLFAFDLNFSNIKISSVESLIDAELEIYWSDTRIVALAKSNAAIPESSEWSSLFRINIEETEDSEICLSSVTDVVNKDYEKMLVEMVDSCQIVQDLTSISNLDFNLNINLFPNPANDFLWIQWDNLTKVDAIELLSLTGKTIIKQKNISEKTIKIETGSLANGVYFIKIINEDQSFVTRKFVIGN